MKTSPQELFQALANVVKQMYSEDWRQTRKNLLLEDQKQAYYFSIEFFTRQNVKEQSVEYAAVGASKSRF